MYSGAQGLFYTRVRELRDASFARKQQVTSRSQIYDIEPILNRQIKIIELMYSSVVINRTLGVDKRLHRRSRAPPPRRTSTR